MDSIPRGYLAISLLMLLLTTSLSGCILSDTGHIKNDVSISIGIDYDIGGFYPYVNSYDVGTVGFNFNIYEGLVHRQSDFTIVSRLASSWTNPDALTWRFCLQENVSFHNGDMLTSEDVKYSIDYIIQNNESMLKELVEPIHNITIIDRYTIEITTKQPSPVLLNRLVELPIINKDYIQSNANPWPVGTGAYKLTSYVFGYTYTLERFDEYWGDTPDIHTLTIQVMPDDEERIAAFTSREIDIVDGLSSKDKILMGTISGLHIRSVITPSLKYISFNFCENATGNQTRTNPLADVRVRKALYHAFNITELTNNISTEYIEPATQLLSPFIYGYDPDIKRPAYDLDLARSLLQEAGYPEGFDITLDIPISWNEPLPIGDEIAKQFSKIINITVNTMQTDEYFMKILTRKSDLYVMGWIPTTGDGAEIYDYLLHTVDDEKGEGGYNLGYYSNPRVDSIGENISYILDSHERLQSMYEGFNLAMDEVYCIPLYYTTAHYGVSDDLQWTPRPDLELRCEEICINRDSYLSDASDSTCSLFYVD